MADGPGGPSGPVAPPVAPAPGTILQGGRAKAYRPMPAADREAAFLAGLDAYDRGDFFLAHELLEPAWMGTADLGERELYQGLIKLAAAFVHGVRGNPTGIARNLDGARSRLAAARDAGVTGGIDLDELIAAVDDRIERLADGAPDVEPPRLRRNRR
jgi:predicted metal-dependent hydrolase